MLRMEAKCFSSAHHPEPSNTLLIYNLSVSDKLREIADIQASIPNCLTKHGRVNLIDRPSSVLISGPSWLWRSSRAPLYGKKGELKMETRVTLEEMLHGRILAHCMRLYLEGHFRHAAREAMTQVELAMKEKSGEKHLYGVRLVNTILGKGNGIKLVVPFGPEMQIQAHALFQAAFSYYRNYATHDGSKIDHHHCLRIMVVASELLDLVSVSEVSFADLGGVKGLVAKGIFASEREIQDFLKFLSDCVFPEDVMDGFFEDMAKRGFTQSQMKAVIDTGLLDYKSEEVEVPQAMRDSYDDPTEMIGSFSLTPLGKEVLRDLGGRPV